MAYCTVDDIRNVLKGTAGTLPSAADQLDESQLEQALTDAQTEIDLALARRYVVPFNPVPEPIKQIAINIAVYLADLTFRMSKDYGATPNPIRLRYERAKHYIDGIVSGQFALVVPGESIASGEIGVFNPYTGDLITIDHLFGPAIYGSRPSSSHDVFYVDDITKVALP